MTTDKEGLIAISSESLNVKGPPGPPVIIRQKPRCKRFLFTILGFCIGFGVGLFLLHYIPHPKHRHGNWFTRLFLGDDDSTKDSTSQCPRLISRSGWNAKAARGFFWTMPPGAAPIVVVHQTGSRIGGCHYKKMCLKKLRQLQNFHMYTKGDIDIGYNFMIGGDGNIYEGRGWNVVGNHTSKHNKQSYGIAMIGDFRKSAPGRVALHRLKSIIRCGVNNNWIKDDYILKGGEDLIKTDSFGTTLYNIIRSWPHFRLNEADEFLPLSSVHHDNALYTGNRENDGRKKHHGHHHHHTHHHGNHTHHHGNHTHHHGNHTHYYDNHTYHHGNHTHYYGNHTHYYGNHTHYYGNHTHHYGNHTHYYGNHTHYYGNNTHHHGNNTHHHNNSMHPYYYGNSTYNRYLNSNITYRNESTNQIPAMMEMSKQYVRIYMNRIQILLKKVPTEKLHPKFFFEIHESIKKKVKDYKK